jgi:hypothetical protein
MYAREKYGEEFSYQLLSFKKADGSELPFHEIGVCSKPKLDEAATLTYAWAVMRELTWWACEEFRERPKGESYRIVVAWSKSVRPAQGHIVKIWLDLAGVREVSAFTSPEECAARFGGGWMPFYGWQKDVFQKTA